MVQSLHFHNFKITLDEKPGPHIPLFDLKLISNVFKLLQTGHSCISVTLFTKTFP